MMKRGEVWWVNFDPSLGGEIQKTRPAVIISNDAANKILNRIQVIPITSNVSKCYPCEANIQINGKVGKAMADQIVTVSKLRIKNKIGVVSSQDMWEIERAIRIQLGLTAPEEKLC